MCLLTITLPLTHRPCVFVRWSRGAAGGVRVLMVMVIVLVVVLVIVASSVLLLLKMILDELPTPFR
jgi:hypothetical protein